jgi:hypothetical protein
LKINLAELPAVLFSQQAGCFLQESYEILSDFCLSAQPAVSVTAKQDYTRIPTRVKGIATN